MGGGGKPSSVSPRKKYMALPGNASGKGKKKKTVSSDDDEILGALSSSSAELPVRLSSTKFRPQSPEVLSIADSDDVPNAGAVLDSDDEAYPEPTVPASVRKLKRSAPLTPPVVTRRAAAKKPIRSPNDHSPSPGCESPTKKSRLAREDHGSDVEAPPQTPTPSRSKMSRPLGSAFVPAKKLFSSSNINRKVEDVPDSEEETFGTSTAFEVPADLPPNVLSPARSSATGTTYLADITHLTIKAIPTQDGIVLPALLDPYLQDKGSYDGLPFLPSVEWEGIKSYAGVSNTTQMKFSGWRNLTPSLRIKTALEAMSFGRDGRYVNLSRANPIDIVGRPVPNESSKYDICVVDGVGLCSAICLAPLVLGDSHILSPNTNTGTHNISGIYHTYEWQRYAGLLGLLTRSPVVHTYMYSSAVSFGTFGRPPRATYNKGPDILDGYLDTSGGTSSKSDGSLPRFIPPLTGAAKIPVYDARGSKFAYNKQTFENIVSFPLYPSDIPRGSFVVVGHTVQLARMTGEAYHVYHNVQWVLLLATPSGY